eukprot:405249_1
MTSIIMTKNKIFKLCERTMLQSSLLFLLTIRYIESVDNFLQPWVTTNVTFPPYDADASMICGYDYSQSPDIIFIFGGINHPSHQYAYNVVSNTLQQLAPLGSGPYAMPNSFVTLKNLVYFNNARDAGSFNVYNMTDNFIYQPQGNKPGSSYSECYATDYLNHIYLIGGFRYNGPNIITITQTLIYTVSSHSWSNGPALNVARAASACIYSQINKSFYIFGGVPSLGPNELNNVEVYDTINSQKWILLSKVTLTTPTSYIRAFMMNNKFSDTVFIIGAKSATFFCNTFSIGTAQIKTCPSVNVGDESSGVYVDSQQRIYEFGSKLIVYAEIYPFLIDLSQTTALVHTGERIPIILKQQLDITFEILLICNSLNINYTMQYSSSECIVCDNANNECLDCLVGILPKYNMTKPPNVTCSNVAANIDNNTYIVNNFNITYFQNYFHFNAFAHLLLSSKDSAISIQFIVE